MCMREISESALWSELWDRGMGWMFLDCWEQLEIVWEELSSAASAASVTEGEDNATAL